MYFIILVIVVAVIGGFHLFFWKSEQRKLQARKSISSSDLHSVYVNSKGDVSAELFIESLKKISEIFSVPVDKIRLEDVIGRDIGRSFPLSMIDSMSTEDFYEHIHAQKKQANVTYDDPVNSVADFVKFEEFICKSKQS